MAFEFVSQVKLDGNSSSIYSHQTDMQDDTESLNMTGLTPEEELYYNISYRFKIIMSQPHQLIALILGFVAISSNLLSILALRQCRWSCYFKLLMSLSCSDVLIGCSLVLHKLSKVFNPAYRVGVGPPAARLRSRCVFMVIKALNNTALNSSLLNLMAMALDHYLAILRPLHYHALLTNNRTHVLIMLLWLTALILGFSDFFSAIGMAKQFVAGSELNYCEVVWGTSYQEEFCTFGLTVICLCVLCCIYLRIYLVVRRQQQRDLQHNKKALCTTFLVLGSFILCWLPICLFQLSMFIQVRLHPDSLRQMSDSLYHADQYLTSLLFFNAIADPLIYVCRLQEVRHGYTHVFSCCCKSFYKNQARRRQSESLTVDVTLSHHRKSSSTSHKTDKCSNHTCLSILPSSVTENSQSMSSHSKDTTSQSVQVSNNGSSEVPLPNQCISTDSNLKEVTQSVYMNGQIRINGVTTAINDDMPLLCKEVNENGSEVNKTESNVHSVESKEQRENIKNNYNQTLKERDCRTKLNVDNAEKEHLLLEKASKEVIDNHKSWQ